MRAHGISLPEEIAVTPDSAARAATRNVDGELEVTTDHQGSTYIPLAGNAWKVSAAIWRIAEVEPV